MFGIFKKNPNFVLIRRNETNILKALFLLNLLPFVLVLVIYYLYVSTGGGGGGGEVLPV